jgi:hypothetical protein
MRKWPLLFDRNRQLYGYTVKRRTETSLTVIRTMPPLTSDQCCGICISWNQCHGSGLIESGSGSRVLMNKNWEKSWKNLSVLIKKWNFALLNPDSGTPLNLDPIRILIHNTAWIVDSILGQCGSGSRDLLIKNGKILQNNINIFLIKKCIIFI